MPVLTHNPKLMPLHNTHHHFDKLASLFSVALISMEIWRPIRDAVAMVPIVLHIWARFFFHH